LRTQNTPNRPGNPGRVMHDVVPGEAENGPAQPDQLVLASTVVAECVERSMRLVAVDLDGDTMSGVGEVDPTDRPCAVPNLVLTDGLGETLVATQAQHAGFENRLGQVVAFRAGVNQPTKDTSALTPTPSDGIENRAEALQGHQLSAEANLE